MLGKRAVIPAVRSPSWETAWLRTEEGSASLLRDVVFASAKRWLAGRCSANGGGECKGQGGPWCCGGKGGVGRSEGQGQRWRDAKAAKPTQRQPRDGRSLQNGGRLVKVLVPTEKCLREPCNCLLVLIVWFDSGLTGFAPKHQESTSCRRALQLCVTRAVYLSQCLVADPQVTNVCNSLFMKYK